MQIIAKPLEITGKNARFQWKEERQAAFETLKMALLKAPVLQLADISEPFPVYTDASDLAIGAVLLQEVDREWLLVAYASKPKATTQLLKRRRWLWFLLSVLGSSTYSSTLMSTMTTKQCCIYAQKPT